SGTWTDLNPAQIQSTAITARGFTEHEHLNAVQLIHMNGRVYDYQLGRFLSVDPFIQFPLISQSLNPYSYIMNNPLAGTDPTGYCEASVGTHITDCRDMEAVYSDGSTKDLGSINHKNPGEMASTLGFASQFNGTKSNGAQGQTIDHQTQPNTTAMRGEDPKETKEKDQDEGANAHMTEQGLKIQAALAKSNFSDGREYALNALANYCTSTGNDCGPDTGTVDGFKSTTYRWSPKLTFDNQDQGSKDIAAGTFDPRTKAITLYSGGIVLQGKGIDARALAEVLLHEYRHTTNFNLKLWNDYVQTPDFKNNDIYIKRPNEIDAFDWSRKVMGFYVPPNKN
ncbi:MAG: hypothetical protein JSR26_09610, partial [Proteobacteria bacterium]|nr:hypothetical protein [Pseudomonadota bacterium]